MCGPFTASFGFRKIKLLFNLQLGIPLVTPGYNVAPSQEVPVIVHNNRERTQANEVRLGSVLVAGSINR